MFETAGINLKRINTNGYYGSNGTHSADYDVV